MTGPTDRWGEQDARTLLHLWYDAWNAHDPAAIAGLVTRDVRYEDPTAAEPLTFGRAAVQERARKAFASTAEVRLDQREAWVSQSGRVTASAFTMSGTMVGKAHPGLLPTGRSFTLGGMDRSEIRDGLLSRHSIYVDTSEVARQLGLAPQRGSRAERAGISIQNLATRLREIRR